MTQINHFVGEGGVGGVLVWGRRRVVFYKIQPESVSSESSAGTDDFQSCLVAI